MLVLAGTLVPENRLTNNKTNRAGHGRSSVPLEAAVVVIEVMLPSRPYSAWGRRIDQRQVPADRSDLINRIGNVDELPCWRAMLRFEKRLLPPGKLRRTEHCAVWIVGARACVVGICWKFFIRTSR